MDARFSDIRFGVTLVRLTWDDAFLQHIATHQARGIDKEGDADWNSSDSMCCER